MATSLDQWQNIVLFHHLHVKCFHTVKRLWKSVQYIRRYSTKYVEPRRQHATQFRLAAETTGPIFTKFLHNIAALVALLNPAHTRRYHIPFLNTRATKWSLPIFAQNRLPWQRPLRYRKKRSRSIIYTQQAFIRRKDCENRYSGSSDNLSPRNH